MMTMRTMTRGIVKAMANSVKVQSGAFTYQQTDMTLGSMQPPYQLQFRSEYDSRNRFKNGPLGLGWNHNWMISASERSDGFKGLGSRSPIEAAASIVEMMVHFDLLDDTDYPILNTVSASLCNSWWADQLTKNKVTIDGGANTHSYLRLPDGSYHAPRGYASELVKNMDGSFTLTDKHQNVQEFATDGNLTSWEFPNGVSITLSYTTGQLSSVTNGMGRTLSLSYTGDKLDTVSDGNSRSVAFSFDVDDQLEAITDLMGEDTTFSYSASGLMESFFLPENPSSAMVTNSYDSLDRLESQLDVNSEESEFYFAGWRSEFENALDFSKVSVFDRAGNMVKGTDELGNETTFSFDGLGRLLQKTLPEGNSFAYTYDDKSNVLTETRSPKPGSTLDEIVVTKTYDGTFNLVETVEDGRGNTTSFSYDPTTGNLLTIERPEIDGEIPTVTLKYNARGQVLSQIDETGIQTQFTYDATKEQMVATIANTNWKAVIGGTVTVSDMLTITAIDASIGGGSKAKSYTVVTDDTLSDIAAGLAAAINGDSELADLGITARVFGEVLSLSTAPGNTTTFTESTSMGATETIMLSSGLELTTEFDYNDWGDTVSITDPRGNETTFDFDDKRRMIQMVTPTPFALITNFTYDKNDNRLTVERELDAGWQVWTTGYNEANQVVSEKDPLDNETVKDYDELRRLWKITDPELRTTEFLYTARNELQKVIDAAENDAQEFTYTSNGLKASQKDARGNITSFTYDGFDRLEKKIFPSCEGFFEENALYDENDNVLTIRTRAGETVTFEFDVLNRMVEKSPEGMAVVTFSYDLAGRLISASTPAVAGNPASGEWEFEFDSAGRFVSEEAPDGKTVSYEHDEVGNVVKIVYPDSYYVDREFDEMNRLTDIKLNGSMTAAAHLDYDDLSRRTKLTFDNSVETDYGYELNNDLSSIEHAFNGSDLDFTYGFNDAHQATSQSVSDAQHMWHPSAGGTIEFGEANELDQYRFTSGSCGRLFKGYNANGCLTDDGVFQFEYDAENHLVSAGDGTTSASYVYDPMHRQIQKNVDGTKTRFVYAGWQRLADYDGTSGSLINRFIYGAGLDEPLITVASGGTLTYMHADRLGSIVALTDDTGAVINRYAYSPFGECDDMSGTTFGFTGQRFDAETGLYYYKRRYYSPVLGRFLQPDPVPNINLYRYVNNDPLNLIDPLGEAMLGLVVIVIILILLALALSGCQRDQGPKEPKPDPTPEPSPSPGGLPEPDRLPDETYEVPKGSGRYITITNIHRGKRNSIQGYVAGTNPPVIVIKQTNGGWNDTMQNSVIPGASNRADNPDLPDAGKNGAAVDGIQDSGDFPSVQGGSQGR